MKKTLFSIIFALALSVMLFVTASATETTKAEEWYNKNAGSGIVLDATNAYKDGEKVKMQYYIKDENMMFTVMTSEIGEVRVIVDGGKKITMFSPEIPYIHMKMRLTGVSEVINSFNVANLSPGFVKSYEETDGETVYYVEEFANTIYEDAVYKFYFIGDELDKIEIVSYENGTRQSRMALKITSYGVDESIFKVPWYSINITFLVILFGLFKL